MSQYCDGLGLCVKRTASTPPYDDLALATATLQRIAEARVAFNAHPAGVITSMQEWAKEALAALKGGQGV